MSPPPPPPDGGAPRRSRVGGRLAWMLAPALLAALPASPEGAGPPSPRGPGVSPAELRIERMEELASPTRQQILGLRGGLTTEAEALGLLGKPAHVLPGKVPFEKWEWLYPAPPLSRKGARPDRVPVLRVSFDAAGTVEEWAFVDPLTGRALAPALTTRQAHRRYRKLCTDLPRIRIEREIRPGESTMQEVEGLLSWRFLPDGPPYPMSRPVRLASGDGEVFLYPLEVAAPVYFPALYWKVSFSPDGTLFSASLQGHSGCM